MGLPVSASGLGLRGQRGWAYRDVSFSAESGSVSVIEGEAASGRSSLLLTLAGRMRPTAGTARVGELELPHRLHAVQRLVGLGVFAGLNDLDETLTVKDLVREQLAMRRHFRGRCALEAVLDRVHVHVAPRTYVRDLSPREHTLLGVALGLVGEPEVLVVDDVDTGMHHSDQQAVWSILGQVAADGITVLGSCIDSTPARAVLGTASVVFLPGKQNHLTAEVSGARA